MERLTEVDGAANNAGRQQKIRIVVWIGEIVPMEIMEGVHAFVMLNLALLGCSRLALLLADCRLLAWLAKAPFSRSRWLFFFNVQYCNLKTRSNGYPACSDPSAALRTSKMPCSRAYRLHLENVHEFARLGRLGSLEVTQLWMLRFHCYTAQLTTTSHFFAPILPRTHGNTSSRIRIPSTSLKLRFALVVS